MSIKDGPSNGPVLGVDLMITDYDSFGADLYISRDGDIQAVSDLMNIAQAIMHRLRTIKGELAELGHPDYGSTILDFIGQPNNSVTRSRLRLAIRDTIRQEQRVKELVSIEVKQRLPDDIIHASGAKDEGDLKRSINVAMRSAGKVKEGEELSKASDNKPNEKKYETLISPADILNSVDVEIVFIPIGSATPIQVAFPFNLESASPIQVAAPLSSEVA